MYYKLLAGTSDVLRRDLSADDPPVERLTVIPADEHDLEWQAYARWRDGWIETLQDGSEIVHAPNVPLPADPPPAPTQDELDAAAARQYAKLKALAGMTPAQVQAWCQANITDLVSARDAITTLAIAVSVLARRL